MARLIIPPTRLQPGTPLSDAYAYTDNNFENIVASFGGFSVENVLAFPDNTGSMVIPSGGLGVSPTFAITESTFDDVVFIVPEVSVYVDAPSVTDSSTGYDVDYLYPTGAALSSDQLSCVISVMCGMSSVPGDITFTGSDGKTYHLANNINIAIRNAGASSHTYYIVVGQATYTKSNSFYR